MRGVFPMTIHLDVDFIAGRGVVLFDGQHCPLVEGAGVRRMVHCGFAGSIGWLVIRCSGPSGHYLVGTTTIPQPPPHTRQWWHILPPTHGAAGGSLGLTANLSFGSMVGSKVGEVKYSESSI